MLEINRTISITGSSYIETNDNGNTEKKQIAFMNASIPKNGECTINKSIQERELFNENSESVISDFNEFEKYVYKLSKGLNDE